jgi:hypothetical protein
MLRSLGLATNGLMWYTLQKMIAIFVMMRIEINKDCRYWVSTHWKLPSCQCPHSSMIAIFVMMRREINKDCRYWHIENYLASSVHTAQVCISGRIPKPYASICGSSTRCKQAMKMRRPGNSFDSCCVLSILQYWLYWMWIPNKKLDKGGNISMGKQQYGILRTVHSKLTGTYGQASYSVIIATWCKLPIVVRPLESTNLEDVWD